MIKVERISKHIWSLSIWLFIPVRVWLVVGREGVTLVDAGLPLMAGAISKQIEFLQAGPLRQIVLTHGHYDHVGALGRIMRERQVPVYAHRIEIPYMEGQQPYPGRKKAVRMVAPGSCGALGEDKSGTLEPIGGLLPYHTPGHSPGHVVFFHPQDRVLLSGDLFSSKNGRLHRPLFTRDIAEALRSSVVVKQLKPIRLEVCHGGSVLEPALQMDEYIAETSKTVREPSPAVGDT